MSERAEAAAADFERLKALVDAHLETALPEIPKEAWTLEEAMRYSLLAPGKRLRPVLLLLACECCGGETEEALPYACAVEMIHCYSLIHDDLPAMDDDDLRRGRPTSHRVFGEATAILAGDGLLSAAFERMLGAGAAAGAQGAGRPMRAAYEIAAGCGCAGMIAGQICDIEAEGLTVSAGRLDFIHAHKTGALIRAAVRAGAQLAGASEEMLAQLTAYAEALGLAFQIADDLLDAEGRTQDIGKTAGKDAAAGKATWPAVHGTEAARARLSELTARAEKAVREAGGEPAATEAMAALARTLETRKR
ncbi:MAG: polyprenyl synthetase family protein [Clostridiales Family XIII bacterium]|nr:polyprenyl synthetase family protein [Clostridiales Family XIII bacterium]